MDCYGQAWMGTLLPVPPLWLDVRLHSGLYAYDVCCRVRESRMFVRDASLPDDRDSTGLLVLVKLSSIIACLLDLQWCLRQ